MSYPGSKAQAGTWQRIIGQMPPHRLYVEPFFGSGQIFWRKRRALHTIAIDLRQDVLATLASEPAVTAICGDALRWLETIDPKLAPDTVVYCDPPYLLSTRQGRFYYDHEMSDEAHVRLLMLLQALKCHVLLSGYPSELYSSQLQDWRCIQYRARTRGKTVVECLWCNFAERDELHDCRYAGQNFRQRLAWRRLAGRWLDRLDRMPGRKRGYLLDAIAQRQNWRADPPTPKPALAAIVP